MSDYKIETPINVLVTAMGGGGHGEQILKALLQDKTGLVRVFGGDANPNCPQFKLVEKSFVLPLANDPSYMQVVLDICAKNGVKALFHGCEPELKLFSRERERIKENGIFLPVNPQNVIDICMDKVKTAEFLSSVGFEPPNFLKISSKNNLNKVDFFPAVIKPSIGGGGSVNCYIVQSQEELNALAVLLDIENSDQVFMIQEYVGTPDQEYTVGVLHDMDGNFINSIAIKRELKGQLNIRLSVPNKTNKKELGKALVISSGISHGYVDTFPEVTGSCERLAKKIGARGAINIQCRLVDGKVKVFEINPRFSGTTSIRAMMGYNEPLLLLRHHIIGEELQERFKYSSGLVMRSLQEVII
ncbi:ATP-grasp domain-containing protein [Alphaproteobacteria bacterium]|nr:ATP-grasp domain-containing protein [Alphaproteobacteria bacterium]